MHLFNSSVALYDATATQTLGGFYLKQRSTIKNINVLIHGWIWDKWLADWLTNIGRDGVFALSLLYQELGVEVQQSIIKYMKDELGSAPSALSVYSIECTENI